MKKAKTAPAKPGETATEIPFANWIESTSSGLKPDDQIPLPVTLTMSVEDWLGVANAKSGVNMGLEQFLSWFVLGGNS